MRESGWSSPIENLFKPAGRLPRALAAASVQRYDPRVMQGGRKRFDSPASSAESKMSTAIDDAMMLRRIAEGGGPGERLIDRLDIGARRGRGLGYRTLPPVGFLTADRRCTQSSTHRSRSHQVSPLEIGDRRDHLAADGFERRDSLDVRHGPDDTLDPHGGKCAQRLDQLARFGSILAHIQAEDTGLEDGVVVAAHLLASLPQHLELSGHLRAGKEIAGIGVPRHQA